MDQHNRITLWEFIKPGWTYHAKGLWYTLPDQRKPSLTLIGSSNFGKVFITFNSNFKYRDIDDINKMYCNLFLIVKHERKKPKILDILFYAIHNRL